MRAPARGPSLAPRPDSGPATSKEARDAKRFTRESTYVAGDAYYVPPDHIPVHYAGAEIVEFNPTEELGRTIPVVIRNVEAAGAAS
jgi:hypothetical protein